MTQGQAHKGRGENDDDQESPVAEAPHKDDKHSAHANNQFDDLIDEIDTILDPSSSSSSTSRKAVSNRARGHQCTAAQRFRDHRSDAATVTKEGVTSPAHHVGDGRSAVVGQISLRASA
jgi:ElaB/YqjD/DUF883 family membrane-anchored ribosome-binding protein